MPSYRKGVSGSPNTPLSHSSANARIHPRTSSPAHRLSASHTRPQHAQDTIAACFSGGSSTTQHESGITPDGTSFHVLTPKTLVAPSIPAGTIERRTLVFIHGVGMRLPVWQPQVAAFSEAGQSQPGYRVVVYDTLGHGNSRIPAADVSLSDYVHQLATLLGHLQINRAHIIGHSMGALIALGFALAHPSKTLSLLAMNAVYRRTIAQRNAVLARAEEVLRTGKIIGVDAALSRWFDVYPDFDTQRIEQIRAWMLAADPLGYGRAYRVFAQSDAVYQGQLASLHAPSLFLTGAHDINSTPAMSQQLADEASNASCLVLPKDAHMMAYASPEKVNAVIAEFVDKSDRAGGLV